MDEDEDHTLYHKHEGHRRPRVRPLITFFEPQAVAEPQVSRRGGLPLIGADERHVDQVL